MNILFVCTGNTCRSCMAEAIFNNMCSDKNIFAESVGFSVVPNSNTSLNSAKMVKDKLSLDISERKAVQLNTQHIEGSDLILTMTSYIKDILRESYPSKKEKIFTLNEYVGVKGDIIDPYGGSIAVYEETFFELKNSIELLINKLKEDRV
ncbi:low molecular weight protein arginine phosphatase [Clostridium sp. MSJ-4]|uniref:Low molecular weight protein arginine phosphatase n=1 Tax=Clostridium simiarum TaxID=2841506 RepID=A0ABS6EVQ8_9CLOT|nr:low molecular weight protein arginine phosphatase [Clostridium simiarum]